MTRADEGEGREPGEALFHHALDAAYYEARDLADKAGVSWLNAKRIADAYYAPVVHHDDLTINSLKHSLSSTEARAAQAEAEVVRLTQERDEALCLAEGPSTLLDLARGSVSRGMELHAAEAEVARLRERVATLEAALQPFVDYAADMPGADFGEGEIGEYYHDGFRRSIRTQHLCAARTALEVRHEDK